MRRYRCVRTAWGSEVRIVDCLDDSTGIVDYLAGRDYFVDILADYLSLGRARVGSVGGASSELIEAADLVDFGVTWMAAHLAGAGGVT